MRALSRPRLVAVVGATWLLVAAAGTSWGELPVTALDTARQVTEGDWLELKLEVLGQQISFPAYRIHLSMEADRRIAFEFLASGGLAGLLRDAAKRSEAEEIMTYHANGIREQVESLLQAEFPALWARYDGRQDLRGRFLGPGQNWNSPPLLIGEWREGRLVWSQ